MCIKNTARENRAVSGWFFKLVLIRSDDVVGLLVLVNQRILLFNLVEDGDLCLDVFGLHEQLRTIDQPLIPGMVEAVGAHGELVPHIGLQRHFFFVPDQLVVAVCGIALLVVQGSVIQNGSGNFLILEVLVDDLCILDLHGTLGAVDLIDGSLSSVSVGGVDFHLIDGAGGVVHTA